MVKMEIPRSEHPRPDFQRDDWINLNGTWQFEFDHGASGEEQNWQTEKKFGKEIVVPFAMESELSGIGHKDFVEAVWYRRSVRLPETWKEKCVLLHIEACDFESRVYVNGRYAGKHKGGYTPLLVDITPHLRDGENIITISARDDLRSGLQPAGKQSDKFASYGCSYTRTTGIWQTVWLEAVPKTYISNLKMYPDIDNSQVVLKIQTDGLKTKGTIRYMITADGQDIAEGSSAISDRQTHIAIKLPETILWQPGAPFLYEVKLELNSSDGVDVLRSYFGMRKIHIEGRKIYLNNELLYIRSVLDQGYYPDGIYTAPDDDSLRKDIELSQAVGFNGARLHQKVFEPRFLYWADKLGYLVWAEAGNWKCNLHNPLAIGNFIDEWVEVLERDFNHPSIIGWCPLNETSHFQGELPAWLHYHLYQLNKTIDTSRLAIDTSGYIHYDGMPTDIYDVHAYQMPDELEKVLAPLKTGQWQQAFKNQHIDTSYDGSKPYFVSEFGGIWWNPESKSENWGYGDKPKSENEFIERYRKTVQVLLDNPEICGWCYTQLYDIEQETNGLYYYDRQPKFSPQQMEELSKINTSPTKYLAVDA